MSEYSKSARGTFTSTGAAKAIYLPFQPNIIRMKNYSIYAASASGTGFFDGYWDVGMGQGTAMVQTIVTNPPAVLALDTVATNGFSTFSAGLSLQYGAPIQISGITKASPAVVTTAASHGYTTGDIVLFQGLYQSSTTGMAQIDTVPFVVTVTGATTFTIPWNTNQSNYTALSASPTGAFVRKVLYPFLYSPGTSVITAITRGTTTAVTTTVPHNFVVGQEVAFFIPPTWGTTELNQLPNTSVPGSPAYGFVTTVNSSTQVTVNIDSSSYTAFNTNQTIASVPGLSYPQIFAAGDVNTGGVAYSGGNLYPSPVVNGVSTINGPAINGSFVNNTRQGFVIGSGVGAVQTGFSLVGTNGQVIYWEALLTDM